MSKILQFPYERLEVDNDSVDYNNLGDIFESIILMLYEKGYHISSKDHPHEYMFLYDSLKSLIYKMGEKEHAYQHLAEVIYSDFYEEYKSKKEKVDTE